MEKNALPTGNKSVWRETTGIMYVNTTLFCERPEDNATLPVERAAYSLLDKLAIPYVRVEHDAADTIEQCVAVENALGAKICKNLFLTNAQKSMYYLLLMPGAKRFRTKDLSKQIGSSRLSFADAEDMERFLGVLPGSASVLALVNDVGRQVRLVIDQDLLENHYFVCHPCRSTGSIRMGTVDLLERLLPGLDRQPLLVELPE